MRIDIGKLLAWTWLICFATYLLFAFAGPAWALDTDGDGIPDEIDNCTHRANPDQHDSNGDGCGNFCDPDIDNDGSVSISEVFHFNSLQGCSATECPDEDLDGSGTVSATDLAIAQGYLALGYPPGPSGLGNCIPPEQPIATVTKAELQASDGVWVVPGVGEFWFVWFHLPDGSHIELWPHFQPVNPFDDTQIAGDSYTLKLPPNVDRFRATLEQGDFIAHAIEHYEWPYDFYENGELVHLSGANASDWTERSITPLFGGICRYPVAGGDVGWVRSFSETCDEQNPHPSVVVVQQAISEYINAFAHCDKPETLVVLIAQTTNIPDATSNGRIAVVNRDWFLGLTTPVKKASVYHELHHNHQGHLMGQDFFRSWLIESASVFAEAQADPDNTTWISRYIWSDRMPARGLSNTNRESLYTPAAFLHHINRAMPEFDLCELYEEQGSLIRNTLVKQALENYVRNGPRPLFEAWQHNYHHYHDTTYTPYADLIPAGPANVVDLENGELLTIGQTVVWNNPSKRRLCLFTIGNPNAPSDTVITMMEGMSTGIRIRMSATEEGSAPMYSPQSPVWWELEPGQYSFAVTSVDGISLFDTQPLVDLQVVPCQ